MPAGIWALRKNAIRQTYTALARRRR